jgi:TetR/AcrR family transcriptional regulator, transcriptional repressor for nem operon
MPRPSTRERILAAGRDLIHRNGFSASGVAEITAAAGVPKGSFYNHYESKEAFGRAALDSYWQLGTEAFVPLRGKGPARKRVRAHFAAVDALVRPDDYAAGCMLGNFAIEAGPLSNELRDRAAALFESWTSGLAACLREGQADRSISAAVPPETLARFLIAAWQGAVQRAKVERNSRATAAFHATLDAILAPKATA